MPWRSSRASSAAPTPSAHRGPYIRTFWCPRVRSGSRPPKSPAPAVTNAIAMPPLDEHTVLKCDHRAGAPARKTEHPSAHGEPRAVTEPVHAAAAPTPLPHRHGAASASDKRTPKAIHQRGCHPRPAHRPDHRLPQPWSICGLTGSRLDVLARGPNHPVPGSYRAPQFRANPTLPDTRRHSKPTQMVADLLLILGFWVRSPGGPQDRYRSWPASPTIVVDLDLV